MLIRSEGQEFEALPMMAATDDESSIAQMTPWLGAVAHAGPTRPL